MTFSFSDTSYTGDNTKLFGSDTTSDLDKQNIDKLNTKRSVTDYDKTLIEAANAATETAANNQSARDKSTLSNTLNEKSRYDDRTSAAKQSSDRVQSSLKSSFTDPDKSADRTLSANEGDKNRYNQSNESAQKTSADRANNIDDNASAKEIAKIEAQTNRETQRASTERAKIAAEAQVSSALLGKQHNYGGYS